ncbi:MAG: lipopolysaccharide heptosyltransferase II [Phycisphaera sp.]|nr:lipopolysaccharide heptosyltransferase II [Phycisphaera sp.]
MSERERIIPRNLVVVLPTWVGDVVMATPTLRVLRESFRDAHITWVVKPYAKPVVDAAPWADSLLELGSSRSMIAVASQLWRAKSDVAVLLPNSFRAALLVRMAGIDRRIGYDRDGRGFMLTDAIAMRREETGRPAVVPAIDYYLRLARYMGIEALDRRMELFTRDSDDAAVETVLGDAGLDVGADTPLVMLNPGAANHGDAKLWAADRFGALADRLIESRGARVLVNGSPKERPILDQVHAASKHELIDLPKLGSTLQRLKSFVKRCDLVVTNDTGPRHIAAALGTPVVSLFGPTDPEWTRLGVGHERIIRDGSCTMDAIDVETVTAACEKLIDNPPIPPRPEPRPSMVRTPVESESFEVD